MEQLNSSNNLTVNKSEKSHKLRNSIIAIICFLIIFVFLYLIIFKSKVKNISIKGNYVVSDQYIKDLVEIDTESRYLFISTTLKKIKAEKSPFIKEINISTGKYNSINIEIVENMIVGYVVNNDSTSYFILEDGSLVEFDASVIKSLALIPLFVDISDELIPQIASQLGKIDKDILFRICELECTSFTYETNMLKLTMDDGHYIYSSIVGMPYINQYTDIVCNNKVPSSHCILIVEEYSSAAVIDCGDIKDYQVKKENS